MNDEMNVNRYTAEQVDTFLLSYEGLVLELSELDAAWNEMDAMEQDHHRVMFGQAWGTRRLLGMIFRAGQLTHAQEIRLAQLDQQLLEQSRAAQHCYHLDSFRLLEIFVWGTPLSLSRRAIHIEIEPRTLNELALVWGGR